MQSSTELLIKHNKHNIPLSTASLITCLIAAMLKAGLNLEEKKIRDFKFIFYISSKPHCTKNIHTNFNTETFTSNGSKQWNSNFLNNMYFTIKIIQSNTALCILNVLSTN